MDDGCIHVQVLQVFLLVADDHVHVVLAAETVVGDRQQGVHIGRKVNARDIRALVDDHIEKARVLVGEAVVILTPHGGGDQQVQGGDGLAPGKVAANLQPLGVLVEHGINDVNERFIGRQEPVPSGEQVAFQHSLHRVFAQHLHHPAVAGEFSAVLVFGKEFLDPEFFAHGINGVQLV